MSDPLQGVTRVEMNPGQSVNQTAQPSHLEPGPKPLEAGAVTAPKGKDKNTAPEKKAQPAPNSLAEVRLKFQVDSETNDVTVLIMEKASNKVIRTIPPEELKNFQGGELFEVST